MSELSVIEKTPKPNTMESLHQDLLQLGIECTDILLVHASLSTIGWIAGSEIAVIQALQKTVANGTLVMPSHTGENSDPKRWGAPPVPKDWIETIYQNMPAFDKRISSTRGMGKIAESFRKFPGVERSNHPQTSFAAVGKEANFITTGHQLTPQFGVDSPLGKLYELDAKILLLGVSYGNCTPLHLAELLSGMHNYYEHGAAIYNEFGVREWVWFNDMECDDTDFLRLGKDYEQQGGSVVNGKVGLADVKVLPFRELINYGIEWFKANRTQDENGRYIVHE